jgi:hypothetical protein
MTEIPLMVPSAEERLGRIDGGPDIIAELETAYRDGYLAALALIAEPSEALIEAAADAIVMAGGRYKKMASAVLRAIADKLLREVEATLSKRATPK